MSGTENLLEDFVLNLDAIVRLGGSIDSGGIEVYLSYLEKSMVYILKATRQMR